MRVVRAAVAVIVAMMALSMPAQAAFEDVAFTPVVTDGADHADFLDIREVAVGEPGDGTLVLRLTSGGNAGGLAQLSFAFFFTTPDGNFAMGANGAGAPFANGNINSKTPDACSKAGAVIHCVVAYEGIGAFPGDTLASTYAITYAAAAQDYGPGAGGFHNSLLGSRGSDYLLTGCTLNDASACFPEAPAGPSRWFEDLSAPGLEHAFANTTSDTYHLNFTTDLANSTATFAWNATAGSVNATLTDANGTVLLDSTFEGNGTLAHPILSAATGTWNLTLAYAGFNGTLAFELAAPASIDPAPTPDTAAGNGTETNTTATLDPLPKETPMPLVAPVLGIVAVVAARRR